MARETTSRPQPSMFGYLAYLIVTLMIATTGTMAGIWLMLHGAPATPAAPNPPTAEIARPPAAPPAQNTGGVYTSPAAADSAYATAVSLGEHAIPVPNTDATNDRAPLVVESKPSDRLPAGGNVPTAEPVLQVGDQFGSKAVIVNPQVDHQCRHAQVWTDSGCKNPTPEGGN